MILTVENRSIMRGTCPRLTDRPISATAFVNIGGKIIWMFEISYRKEDIQGGHRTSDRFSLKCYINRQTQPHRSNTSV